MRYVKFWDDGLIKLKKILQFNYDPLETPSRFDFYKFD